MARAVGVALASSRGPASSAAAMPSDAGQILGAGAIAALLPAGRRERRRDRAPAARRSPIGPPNLCAESAMKSASGSASLPAPCAQSTSSSPPAARTAAAIAPSGWITPVSLLTCCTATSAAPACSSAARAASDRPARRASTGSTPRPRAARSTASCSTAETTAARADRSASARSPAPRSRPQVKITSPAQPSAAAIRARASSSAARAARPSACGEDGLAQRA